MNVLLDFIPLVKESYLKAVSPVCTKYNITVAEFDVLMFLANNPEFDRATDIVEKRHIVKSQVSTSVNSLKKMGYLDKKHTAGNRKNIHLSINSKAENIISDGRKAQKHFFDACLTGFSENQKFIMKENMQILIDNMRFFVKEK